MTMAEFIPNEVDMTVSESVHNVPLRVSPSTEEFAFTIDTSVEAIAADPYEGAYTVTPGAEAQELQTSGLQMLGNIIVEAIPSNYGLITWDGATLTVS